MAFCRQWTPELTASPVARGVGLGQKQIAPDSLITAQGKGLTGAWSALPTIIQSSCYVYSDGSPSRPQQDYKAFSPMIDLLMNVTWHVTFII